MCVWEGGEGEEGRMGGEGEGRGEGRDVKGEGEGGGGNEIHPGEISPLS